MTDRFDIFYADRELARHLNDPKLGQVQAHDAEEAVRVAGRNPEIIRKAMPCASLWAVKVKEQDQERQR